MFTHTAMDTQTLFEQRPATVFLLIVDGVLGTVAGGYGVVNAVAGYPVTAAAQILTAIVAGVSLVLIVRDLRTGAATTALPRHLTFGVTVMLSVVLLASGGGTSDVSPFMFVVPPAVMLLGSRRTATVVNFLFWLVLAVSVARPGATAWVQGTDRLYHLSTLIAYTAVNVYVFMLTDLSYRAYRRVRFLATHDPVTGLHRFDTRESSAVEGPYAVLLQLRETDRIRLEGGNRFVEEVMQALAQRLARRKSEACGLYAYSDTSLLVSPALDTSDRWPAWINGTMQDLTRPVRGSERTHTPQLAVYVVPEADRLTRSELGGRLETTIQGNRGGGGVAFYDANLDRMLRARVEMHDLLRSARDRGELSLAYQPLVDAIDGDVVGAEVLMRWHSAVLGPVSPATFIPVAEETGMIGELTEWMLVRAWRETCGAPPSRFDTLSVNVSPAHLEQPTSWSDSRISWPVRGSTRERSVSRSPKACCCRSRGPATVSSMRLPGWGSRCRSTTSEPATPTCPICGSSPSIVSRSIAPSSRTWWTTTAASTRGRRRWWRR